MIDNVLKIFGVSKFITWTARSEGIGTALMKQILPPFKFINAATKDGIKYWESEGEVNFKDFEMIQSIPVVGKPFYWREGKGADKREQMWDRRFAEAKKKLKKTRTAFEKSEDKRAFRAEHSEELLKYGEAKRMQSRLTSARTRINKLKKLPETAERKAKIEELTQKRTKMIEDYLNKM
jgi:hypothetical protein